MSSEDTGVDEAQVQSLLKKHKDVTDELKNYANVIQQLKQQVFLQFFFMFLIIERDNLFRIFETSVMRFTYLHFPIVRLLHSLPSFTFVAPASLRPSLASPLFRHPLRELMLVFCVQAQELSPEDASSPEVLERLAAIDLRHAELAELARLRKQRLLDALSLFKLLAEADAADQWIAEKHRMLDTMLPPKDIDDVEIMKHRLVCH